jgi:hypothetical protein
MKTSAASIHHRNVGVDFPVFNASELFDYMLSLRI